MPQPSSAAAPTFVPPPPPAYNGGLYTGEPFARGAPWANVPATPDAGYLMHVALASAEPPAAARYHVPGGGARPGNNTPLLPRAYVEGRVNSLNLLCVPDAAAKDDPLAAPGSAAGRFHAHWYL